MQYLMTAFEKTYTLQQKFMKEMISACVNWLFWRKLLSQFTSHVSNCNIWWCGWTPSDTPFAVHTEDQSTPFLRSRIEKMFFEWTQVHFYLRSPYLERSLGWNTAVHKLCGIFEI